MSDASFHQMIGRCIKQNIKTDENAKGDIEIGGECYVVGSKWFTHIRLIVHIEFAISGKRVTQL